MNCNRYKKNLLVAVFILSATAITAQPDYYKILFRHTKDSLVNELKKYPSKDTSRAVALISILDCAIFLSEKKEVMPYWDECMVLSKKLNFTKAEADCLEWKGGYFKSAHKNDSAIIYLDSAIQLAGNSSEKWLKMIKGFAFFQKGMIYEYQENLYTSLNYYFESLKNYDSLDPVKQKMISLRIASIYQKLYNDEKALEYYQAALQLYEKVNNKPLNKEAEGLYTFIASIYFNRGDLSKAKYYLYKQVSSMPDTVETLVTGGFYHLAGQIAMKENKTDSAIFYLGEALKYYGYTRQMHIDDIANVYADIARLRMTTGELQEAKKNAEQSVAAAEESGHKETIANAKVVAAEYYNRAGNTSAAYEALHEATILNDSVLTEANIKQANTLAAIYENNIKEKKIGQLETDKKIQAATVKQKSLLITIFIIVLVALLLTGVLLYWNFKHKQMLTSQQHLIQQQKIFQLEKEKQLMSVEAMLKGQEEERSRLAKDLHDGLGGMLSGLKMSFSNLKENMKMDVANETVFEKSLDHLDSTIAELRKVAHNLIPEALVKFGLKSALKDFCESMQLSGNRVIIYEQFGTERELGNIADINIYRIIQELLNNAVIHGTANQILVQLTKTPAKVLITVEDNGKGFNLNSLNTSHGIGLNNIKHRVNYFNGKTDIESKPAEGTTVNIELHA